VIGIGLFGAIRDYYLERSTELIVFDLSCVAVGLIGLAIMWWKDRQTKQ
jgi:hypothetical protein